MEHPSGGWGAALSLDLLFHFCHFSELISLDLKKIVTNEFCINQRTNKDLGRSRLAGVPTQPECPRIPSYHLNWTLCVWEGGEGSVGGERTLENVGEKAYERIKGIQHPLPPSVSSLFLPQTLCLIHILIFSPQRTASLTTH